MNPDVSACSNCAANDADMDAYDERWFALHDKLEAAEAKLAAALAWARDTGGDWYFENVQAPGLRRILGVEGPLESHANY